MGFHLSTKSQVLGVVSGVLVLLSSVAECGGERILKPFDYPAINCRKHSALLTEFGGIGDGKTSNTKAFKTAIDHLKQFATDGGAELIVPPGKWLTGSFNLTSHFTLYIHKDAVILGSQEESDYPHIPPLPSYGKGRDGGGRFSSPDIEPYIDRLPIMECPPVYCSDVIIQGMTILAPVDVPNTDGINPDSCANVKIEDCYIVSGDDCIAVKSGWDQYGIQYGVPTRDIVIRRLTCISPDSAVIALGSEMSGGIKNVRAEDITAINSQSGVRIKTGVGRGGYVQDIYARKMTMKTMKYVFWMTSDYGSHPDDEWDRKAIPKIENINYREVVAENVTYSARLDGIAGDKFTGICISDVTIRLTQKPKQLQWNCTNVEGVTSQVTPQSCDLLPPSKGPLQCTFPENQLPIEAVKLKTCSYTASKKMM
ncbi:putative polygalacturonase [Vitis vinifera]|uniref:Putative polygalacturonase n=1 Tax=Vitis vinifera TaxID=29760 RepID=A0A438E2J5_VITVI|nr:putative polygalacturonase [Vitis vinifera]